MNAGRRAVAAELLTASREHDALIEAAPDVTSALVPIGAGLRVVVKDGRP